MNSAEKVAGYLLQSKAIKLDTAKPFTWASGWKSPLYCDSRITLSYPEIRTYIRDAFVQLIKENYTETELVAGVATGGIAQAALVAQEFNLPMVYVRSAQKTHGLENRIEGRLEQGQKTIVIEDLVSTGSSSLGTVEALRRAQAEVLGMLAIFSYGFPLARERFKQYNCSLHTLTDYPTLSGLAVKSGYIKKSELELLEKWRHDPQHWNPS